MNKEIAVDFANVCTRIYGALTENNFGILTRAEIMALIDVKYQEYYSQMVSALASIGRVIKKTGRTGGIEIASKRGMKSKIEGDNKKKLIEYFEAFDIPVISEVAASKNSPGRLDKKFDALLQSFLTDKDFFDLVERKANGEQGENWQNPNLVGIQFHKLKFQLGTYPKLTAIQVRREFPNVAHIQQAASFLRYCHSSYLCFYLSQYAGRDSDGLFTRLQDEGVFELARIFSVGLIVAYEPRKESGNMRFQIITEAPWVALEPPAVDEGIRFLLSEQSQEIILDNLRDQLKNI